MGDDSPLRANPRMPLASGGSHLWAEKYFFPGACPWKKWIGIGSSACGRWKSATLLGEIVHRSVEKSNGPTHSTRQTEPCQDHHHSLPLGGKVGRRKPGRMRGRRSTQRGRRTSGAPSFPSSNDSSSLASLGTGSPPHQSPSVTASPQGEA